MDEPTLDPGYWQQLATLGGTSLLVPEHRGGGSLSDNPYDDLAMVAEVSGRHVAPGPLIPANIVATVIASTPGDALDDVLAGVLDGSQVPAWAIAEGRGTFDPNEVETTATPTDGGYVLTGTKRFVEGAPDADVLLITAQVDEGLGQFLVQRDTVGVSVQRQRGLDPSRSYGTVVLDRVVLNASSRVGPEGPVDEELRRLLDVAIALQAAESVGVMGYIWDMTMEWVQNRFAFGRPIGSYQALKHRLADHKLWFEASAGLVDGLTAALVARDPDASRLASITKAHVGDTAVNLVSDATQMHGGIGVTWEHDLHLYLRRATTNRAMYGSPSHHRERLCALAGL